MDLVEYTMHHAGIFSITAAFIYLFVNSFISKINVPAIFFFLYGAGGFLLAYEMHAVQNKIDIAPLEIIGGLIAVYLGVLMARARRSYF